MFFLMGAGNKSRELEFDQLTICKSCGKYGHIKVIETYSYVSLFFIPVCKWGRRYFAQIDCCGAVCELPTETGTEILRGERTELSDEMLEFQQRNTYSCGKRCLQCGYETMEAFEYCPKCGKKF